MKFFAAPRIDIFSVALQAVTVGHFMVCQKRFGSKSLVAAVPPCSITMSSLLRSWWFKHLSDPICQFCCPYSFHSVTLSRMQRFLMVTGWMEAASPLSEILNGLILTFMTPNKRLTSSRSCSNFKWPKKYYLKSLMIVFIYLFFEKK